MKILLYIIIYSVLGWILESVYKTFLEKKFVNSGFLKGPVCPIYGFGALLMLLTLNNLKDKIILLFIVAFFVLSIWEYAVGLFLEKIFKTKYWDYSHLKFNIQGRVCLKNSIYWGILGVGFIKLVHPFIESKVALIPENYILYINIIAYTILIIDVVASSIKVLRLSNWTARISEIENNIKEKFDELKKQKENKTSKNNEEEIEQGIRRLKLKQARLKLNLYKTANRLKDAFPSMKSESIAEFINQKIDIKALNEKIKRLRNKIIK